MSEELPRVDPVGELYSLHTERESGPASMPVMLPCAQFPEIYVINLDHRTDRWNSIRNLCHDCGLDPVRFSAVQASPGWIGCGLSHQAIVKIAKERQLPWVLILEDDAAFTSYSINRFRSLIPYLWEVR